MILKIKGKFLYIFSAISSL